MKVWIKSALCILSLLLAACTGGAGFGSWATLGGQVLLQDGSPLEGVEITIFLPDAPFPGNDTLIETTDKDGWYSHDRFYLNEKDDTIITPSDPAYVFSPPSYLISRLDGDHLDLDFTAIPVR